VQRVLVKDAEARLYTVGEARLFCVDLTLERGVNDVRIEVELSSGKSSQFSFQLNRQAVIEEPQSEVGSRALIFGTRRYLPPFGEIPNPEHDARALAEILEKFYGFDVETVIDPTWETVTKKLFEEYAMRKYGSDEQLLVFFAGHGIFRDVGRRGMGYLVCSNSRQSPEMRGFENPTLVSYNALRDAIDNIPCKHILVLIDACFGGAFSDDLEASRGGDLSFSDLGLTVSRLLEKMTRRYFTSGGREYVPDAGDDPKHSPFASCLLKLLGDGNRKLITADDIAVALSGMPTRYPRPKAGTFGDHAGGNFVFLRK